MGKRPAVGPGRFRSWLSRTLNPAADGDRVMRAVWNGTVIAESADTVVLEGNHYFPPEALRTEYLRPSDTRTVCPWKGTAGYYSIVVGDAVNRDAAWCYPRPSAAASRISGRDVFWKGVRVEAHWAEGGAEAASVEEL